MFTKEELELKGYRATTFYQDVFYRKLEDTIIDKQFRLIRACEYLGERWVRVRSFLSTKQKEDLEELVKKYARNGGKRLRKIATRTNVA